MIHARLSWSSMTAWEACNMRNLLARQRKRKPIPAKVVMVGNVIHYAAEQIMLGAVPEDQIVEQALLDFDRRVVEAIDLGLGAHEIAEKRLLVEEGTWRLINLLDEEFASVSPDALQSEMHLMKFYKGWALEGYMDIVQMESRTLPVGVYDVKTGSSHDQGQLQFYSVLSEAYFGVRPKRFGWIEPLGRGIVPVTVTDEEHEAMQQRIMRAVVGIKNGEFGTTGFPKACGWCSSKDFCPMFDKAKSGRFV